MSLLRTIKRDKLKFTGLFVAVVVVLHFLTSGYSSDIKSHNGKASKPLNNPPEEGQHIGSVSSALGKKPASGQTDAEVLQSIRDYTVFFNGLEDYAIDAPSLKGKYIVEGGKAPEKSTDDTDTLFSKEFLSTFLDIPESTLAQLKDSHSRYVDVQINKLVENYGVATFGNLLPSDPEWSTYHNSKGYVLVGGGEYSWLSYLVIKQMRFMGSKLPIELFLPSMAEYEKDFCEKILPALNARCNVFDGKLAKNLKDRFNIKGYQYKMLALVSSKFENLLYIDSDNFPTKNIDYLFESELYKERNMILWPDNWARTTNPKYYDIAKIPVKENKLRYSSYDRKIAENQGLSSPKPLSEYTYKDSWYHDFEGTLPDPTSETGMFMINKTSHLKTLLLCLYYNVFGPEFYYPLFTQGSAGEGDKETFIGAAHVMGEPWFQTLKQFQWVGYMHEEEGKFTSKALGHYDPEQSASTDSSKKVDLIFMHLSYPKYYPGWLAENHDLIYEKSGSHIRMYQGVYENIGYDFDLQILQFFTQGLCANYYNSEGKAIDGHSATKSEFMGKYLKYVDDGGDRYQGWCKDIFIPHLKWLKDTTDKKLGH